MERFPTHSELKTFSQPELETTSIVLVKLLKFGAIKNSDEIEDLQKVIRGLLVDIKVEAEAPKSLEVALQEVRLPKPKLVYFVKESSSRAAPRVVLNRESYQALREYTKAVLLIMDSKAVFNTKNFTEFAKYKRYLNLTDPYSNFGFLVQQGPDINQEFFQNLCQRLGINF